VSIFTIILIGLVIAPILTKVETRKYEALIFFLQIPKERLQILIQNCEYCVNMDEEDRYRQILKDYESFLGMKLIDQQIDQMRRKRDQEVNLANQSSMNEYGSGSYRQNSQSTGQYDQIGSGVFESKKISKTNT
jgi:superfamily II DNA helicase RecQ